MKVLMLSKSAYSGDIRVRREAESLTELGHTVTVIGTDDSTFESEGVSVIGTGSSVGMTSVRPERTSLWFKSARWMLLPEHRARAISQFQRSALDTAANLGVIPQVIHAHDYPALEPAARLAKQWGAKLVYDAHEYWPGLPRYGRPEPLRSRKRTARERSLALQADAIVTMSDGAADLLKRDFGIPTVTVIRNSFPERADLAGPVHASGAVYAGRIGEGRDLEAVFSAGVWNDDFRLILIGPVDRGMDVPAGVEIFSEGTMDDVDNLLARIGIALVTLSSGPINHSIALPNKLFQAVSVGVPVVATDLPEISSVVNKYELGCLYKSGDPRSLARAVLEVRREYDRYRSHVETARPQLSWDTDRERLGALYEELAEGF